MCFCDNLFKIIIFGGLITKYVFVFNCFITQSIQERDKFKDNFSKRLNLGSDR